MKPVLPIDSSSGLVLDRQAAREIGVALSDRYSSASPFPHIVLENFLPEDLVTGLVEHFPTERLKSDVHFEVGYAGHHKRQILPLDCDEYCRRAFDFFNA